MEKYNLIFDVSNNFHRSFGIYNHQIPDFDLSNQKHHDMLVRKFVVDFVSFTKLIPTDNLYFCFDGKSSNYFRKGIDSTYKGNRTSKESTFYECQNSIYELLLHKNLNAIKVDGLEADDCMALLNEKLSHLPKILLSQDEDIQQLIQARSYVMIPHAKHRKLLKSFYSVHPPQFPNVPIETVLVQYILAEKVLKGCKGDNVPALAPKGYRTAKINKIADDYMIYKMNNNETELNSFEHAIKQSDLTDITREDIQRQLHLVCLQSQFMPEHLVKEFDKIPLKNSRFIDLEVSSILANTRYWDENFKKDVL